MPHIFVKAIIYRVNDIALRHFEDIFLVSILIPILNFVTKNISIQQSIVIFKNHSVYYFLKNICIY